MHVIVPGQGPDEDIRMHTLYSVRMENSTETTLSFFFLVNYLLNANVSATTAAHMLAMGEILVVLYPYIITLRMQYGLLTESLIAAWMVMVRPALLPRNLAHSLVIWHIDASAAGR